MRIDVGVLKSRLVTDNPKLLKALRELYSFSTPGARYTAAGRSGRWDGKTNFISSSGYFRSGLLSHILEDLKKIECTPEINYTFDRNLITPENWDIPGFSLRDYQDEAMVAIACKHRVIIQSPTGSGKTLMMACAVKALQGRKITILFDAKQLLEQTYSFFVNECGLDNIGINYGEGYVYGDVMLTTVQSVETILDSHLEESEVIMVDEVHKFSTGKHRLAVIQSFPNAQYRIGFTATMPKDQIPKHNLLGAFGPVRQIRTTKDLIDEGKLTRPSIQMLPLKEPEQDYSDESYETVYNDLVVNNKERNQDILRIVNLIKETNEKARILILVNRLEHGKKLQELIGSESFYLRGEDGVGERYATIQSFVSSDRPTVLLGTKILETGIDIREITHFINARGLRSPIATIQALGRSLRLHESKDRVFIYDFMDRGKYIGDHARKRYNTYRKEGHEVEVL